MATSNPVSMGGRLYASEQDAKAAQYQAERYYEQKLEEARYSNETGENTVATLRMAPAMARSSAAPLLNAMGFDLRAIGGVSPIPIIPYNLPQEASEPAPEPRPAIPYDWQALYQRDIGAGYDSPVNRGYPAAPGGPGGYGGPGDFLRQYGLGGLGMGGGPGMGGAPGGPASVGALRGLLQGLRPSGPSGSLADNLPAGGAPGGPASVGALRGLLQGLRPSGPSGSLADNLPAGGAPGGPASVGAAGVGALRGLLQGLVPSGSPKGALADYIKEGRAQGGNPVVEALARAGGRQSRQGDPGNLQRMLGLMASQLR